MRDVGLLPAAQPVTVGWGQKATQFHGSLGKPTAEALKEKVTMAFAVVSLHLWPYLLSAAAGGAASHSLGLRTACHQLAW